MYCSQCGHNNPSGVTQCENCDAVLAPKATPQAQPSPQPPSKLQPFVPPQSQPTYTHSPGNGSEDYMRPDAIRGIVNGFQERSEGSDNKEIVWSFLVHVRDENGTVVERVPVEMRGISFIGAIRDGDIVEVEGRWSPESILETSEVFNVNTGSTVGLSHDALVDKKVAPVLRMIFVGVFLAVILCIGSQMASHAYDWLNSTPTPDWSMPTPDVCAPIAAQLQFLYETRASLQIKYDNAESENFRNFWSEALDNNNEQMAQKESELAQCQSTHPGP